MKQLAKSLGITAEQIAKYRETHIATLLEARRALIGEKLLQGIHEGHTEKVLAVVINDLYPARPKRIKADAETPNPCPS